ncbi:Formyltetrahydrofolate deformylase [Caenispirillum salinarum AK4]|uniref:Formyltetrahydrofolate deformylase n=1 Tax=Caenispirillum salinarum AK4 TaxID=1238182 RepID=K9GRY2_9PROT|nr:formyltetrahydrofolate deformylase [Caenispirillum salinarum]EKV28725.1 Formyltetrahydrofolate deformylase [Caenispirillum salinarum AK4]
MPSAPTDVPTTILTIACPDATGIVAAVTGFLAQQDCFIVECAQYGDLSSDRFFMRAVFQHGDKAPERDVLGSRFAERVAQRFDMTWAMHDARRRPKVLIAVSRFGHCLNDLLHRWQTGQLAIDVAGVVSNHEDMRKLVEWHGIPYTHLPVTKDTKVEQEARMLRMVEDQDIDLVVLARYMQILTPEACRALNGRAINIHHSFLPSFKGAKPYQQAFTRGVKIIGATAHYVTPDLDEGPIIEQAVERVDHTHSVEDLVRVGQDLENVTLARAVRYHIERRVLINGAKTVVFR